MLINDVKKIPLLVLALFILALGIVLVKESNLGLDPWGVFHEGMSNLTGLSFGMVIELIGYIILLLSLLIKIYPGIGTVINILIVGKFIDFLLETNLFVSGEVTKYLFFIVGFVILCFGRALYISCNLGSGPRDGLFVGIVKFTKIDVKYIKPSIELIIFILGVLYGGTYGVGTVLLLFLSGYLVEYFFKLLKYDPKTKSHSSIFLYLKNQKAS